jgi:5-methylcytosine-specific restriction enzyme subunit McrC
MVEWEIRGPEPKGFPGVLRELTLGEDPKVLADAERLARAGVVTVTQLLDGLRIETKSFVGHINLGPLDLTIIPKVAWNRWLRLFGYALRLQDVTRAGEVAARTRPSSLHDLLVLQLIVEVRDLLTRGLHREYERQRRPLAVPRGRIDFARIARGGIRDARIPSRFTRRLEDSLLNRVLLGALNLSARIAGDATLRGDAKRLGHELAVVVKHPELSTSVLKQAWQTLDRRTVRYTPALRLIELLLAGTAVSLEDDSTDRTVAIPGFALDMNGLWQRLLGRVLSEWAPGVRIREEVSLRHIFQRNPTFAPRYRQMPQPRPDLAVLVPGRDIAYLDAKYRDLWLHTLPREMLYQLAVYASAQRSGVAAMLYPTDEVAAAEERLDICDPSNARVQGVVALRPVHLARLEQLVTAAPSPIRERERETFARALLGL